MTCSAVRRGPKPLMLKKIVNDVSAQSGHQWYPPAAGSVRGCCSLLSSLRPLQSEPATLGPAGLRLCCPPTCPRASLHCALSACLAALPHRPSTSWRSRTRLTRSPSCPRRWRRTRWQTRRAASCALPLLRCHPAAHSNAPPRGHFSDRQQGPPLLASLWPCKAWT